MQIRPFVVQDTEAVVALWHQVGITRSWNDPYRDIERKMTVQPELFLVGILDEAVVASAMCGYDGHRGWLYYFAVAPEFQGQGFGRTMLTETERRLMAMGCPKLNVQVRSGNEELIDRYAQWGYERDGAAGLGRRLIAD